MKKSASATYGRELASDRSLLSKELLTNAARRTFALLSAAALLCSVSACAEVVPTDSQFLQAQGHLASFVPTT